MAEKLTSGQSIVLRRADSDPRGMVKKSWLMSSALWRNVDQCVRRGLLEAHGFGVFMLTPAGRAALSNHQGDA